MQQRIYAKTSKILPARSFVQPAKADTRMTGIARSIGNQAMQSRNAQNEFSATNDTLNFPAQTRQLAQNSPAEQEADRIGRSIGEAGEGATPSIGQRSSSAYAAKPALTAQLQQLKQRGKPLSESDRSYFGPRFGRDLSSVRIHDDARAGKLSRGIGAQAFTFGNHIVMDSEQRTGQALSRRALLAHELTHVAQQGGAPLYTADSGNAVASAPKLAAKITVTEEMWRERLVIELRKYRLALESPNIAVRRWSLQEAVKETNTHLGTAKDTFEPAQEIIDKVEGIKPKPKPKPAKAEDDANPLSGKIGNYVDTFDSWDYDVNYDIVKTSGSEWTGASPWLTLHFGGTTINVDMRQIQDRTMSLEEVKTAFANRYVRQGITFPAVISQSTAMNVVSAMEAAREERNEAFAFTNSLMLTGVAAFFMTWPGIAPAGAPGGGMQSPGGAMKPGAWTQRAARLDAIRQTRVAIQPFRDTAQKLAQQAAKDSGKVVVNIGGTAAKGEPAAAINLNPNLEGMGRKNIPNLVETYGEYIGSLFQSNQVDEIVSQGLSPGAFDWPRVISGSGSVLKSGGTIRIQFRWADEAVAQKVAKLMGEEGFESIKIIGDAVITAVKK